MRFISCITRRSTYYGGTPMVSATNRRKLFRATLLKAASHHIPTGRRKLYTQQVPAENIAMMEELSTMNDEITKATSDHQRRQWREFVESIDHRIDSTSCGERSKELTANPSRRKKMRASPSQKVPTLHPS